ncbi:unnamed protein product [Blepharisma stoltei]|uniref:Tubulin/FtsZ 2-layer sandwich domain-containing protein n=1 Tax=Blepharisma stoltei TaxID=1481888 RepID=A0AAU9J5L8_9CILI|nr:unnamed protein product [Blepharisma stoltei]
MRAGGALNADPYEIKNNMVPYPRIHFLFSSYAPLFPSTCTPYSPNCSEITSRCFEPIYMMAKCDPGNGKYMAISLMYRGDVVPKDVSASIAWMKSRRSINFVDWCPTGLKCGINYESPTVIIGGDIAKMSRSALMVCNHTAISEVFSRINGEFDLMYKKKAFVHWYTAEGMEESEFAEAREDLAELQADYKECASDNVDEDTAEDEG